MKYIDSRSRHYWLLRARRITQKKLDQLNHHASRLLQTRWVEDVATPETHYDHLNLSNKFHVEPSYVLGRKPFVLFAAGQSLVANSGGEHAWSQQIFQNVYEWYDGGAYKANAPLFAATDSRQSFVLPLADLIARATAKDVLICLTAVGSAKAERFCAEGDLYPLVRRQLSTLVAAGFRPDAMLWEHGQADYGASPDLYAAVAQRALDGIREFAPEASAFIATDSMVDWRPIDSIREAQQTLARLPGNKSGPNIDLIKFRRDGIHMDQRGLEVQAAMWFQVLAEHFGW